MPFIGQDWRSPGEVWIKTEEGWERMTLIRKSHLLRSQHSCDSKKHDSRSPTLSVRAASSSSLVSTASSSCSDSEIDLEALGRESDGASSRGTSASSSPSTSASSSPRPDITLPSAIAAAAAEAEAQSRNSQSSPLDSEQEFSVVEIIERLAKSSSHPIPDAILKESSHAIETHHLQPFCRVLLAPTKEVVGSNIISEAFYKLDFCNAIRDIRRFPYVSKLLHLLIKQNLTTLSGNATKALFWMLEEIAKQVAQNKQNIHVVRELIEEMNEIVQKYMCWGRPLGSTMLWEQHLKTLERICELTDSIELGEQFEPASSPLLDDLAGMEGHPRACWNSIPEELIREILLRIADYKDLGRTAEACRRVNVLLSEEQHVWRRLCKYHFTKDQQKWATREIKHDINDWQATFHVLRKKFGLKEEYPDCLFLCRYCRCLFWRSKGHPCALDNPDLTTQLTDNVSNTETRTKSEIMASLQQKLSDISTKVRSPSGSSGSSPPSSSSSVPTQQPQQQSGNASNSNLSSSPPSSSRSQQYQRSPQNPVVVQNVPFFDHPLVLAQRRQNEVEAAPQQQENAQQQQSNNNRNIVRNGHRQPFDTIRQRFQNPGNAQNVRNDNNDNNDRGGYQKAPLFVPITPHEFLKFFSL